MNTGIAKRSGLAVAIALAAVAALLLSMTLPLWPAPKADAAVNSIASSPGATTGGAAGTVVTIDANEGLDADGLDNDGDGVVDGADAVNESQITILTSTGTIVVDGAPGPATSCTGGTVLCAGEAGSGTATVTIPDAGNDINAVVVGFVPPALGPATASITAVQAGVSKTANVVVRGVANQVAVSVLGAAPTAGIGACTGAAVASAINSNSASANAGSIAAGTLCTTVKDSAGNALPGATVIYSTTAGTVGGAGLADIASALGRAAASTIAAGTTGTSGTEATITASSGGISSTTKVKFGGDPASCTIAADPATVQTGGSSNLTVTVKDSAGGPPSDGIFVAVAQVNPGAGANAAILGSPAPLTNGMASVQVIAAIPGAIALGATSPVTAAGGATVSALISCTGAIQATGTTATPTASPTGTGTPTPSGLTITPSSPYGSGLNSVVVQGSGTAASVAASIQTSSGKTVLALWVFVSPTTGWVFYLPANPAVNGGLAQFPGPVASAFAVLS